jgi:hypothetical protein
MAAVANALWILTLKRKDKTIVVTEIQQYMSKRGIQGNVIYNTTASSIVVRWIDACSRTHTVTLGKNADFGNMVLLKQQIAMAAKEAFLRPFFRYGAIFTECIRMSIVMSVSLMFGGLIAKTPKAKANDFLKNIRKIWDSNQNNEPYKGITLTDYPKKYGMHAVYYILRDMHNQKLSGTINIKKTHQIVNNVMNQQLYQPVCLLVLRLRLSVT